MDYILAPEIYLGLYHVISSQSHVYLMLFCTRKESTLFSGNHAHNEQVCMYWLKLSKRWPEFLQVRNYLAIMMFWYSDYTIQYHQSMSIKYICIKENLLLCFSFLRVETEWQLVSGMIGMATCNDNLIRLWYWLRC